MEVLLYKAPQQIGTKAVLVEEKRTKLHVLTMDGKLHPRPVAKSERRFMAPATYRNKPYPLARAKRIFKRYGKAHGMTKTARRFLARG